MTSEKITSYIANSNKTVVQVSNNDGTLPSTTQPQFLSNLGGSFCLEQGIEDMQSGYLVLQIGLEIGKPILHDICSAAWLQT